MIPAERLTQLIDRHGYLEHAMGQSGLSGEAFAKLSREYADLDPVVAVARDVLKTRAELRDLEAMLTDGATDPDMRALAEMELPDLKERLPEQERALQLLLLPRDAADVNSRTGQRRGG